MTIKPVSYTHLDHLIPTSIGGPTIVNNLRPACHTCNDQQKGDLTSEDVYKRQGRALTEVGA